jgi:hypothetical protein
MGKLARRQCGEARCIGEIVHETDAVHTGGGRRAGCLKHIDTARIQMRASMYMTVDRTFQKIRTREEIHGV